MAANDDPKTFGGTRLSFAEERDVDQFVDVLEKFERGEIEPDAWRAFRLVNGVYGQRQAEWSMIRCKIPQGIATAPQLHALADVAELWGDGKAHVTTRQNLQFHFVKLADVEGAMRHLGEAGLTTREACGNAVRNVTGCPFAGVAATEPFDVTPYAEAVTRHLLRGRWSSALPRKFKIAFGGCCGTDCVATAINDLGFLARIEGGRRGFRLTVGGGLATMCRSGIVAHDLLPAGEILEAAEAVVRVFDRVGNRADRNRARLKFAIATLGAQAFLELYHAERDAIRREGGRALAVADSVPERVAPAPPPVRLPPGAGYEEFARDNVRPQKQEGFSTVLVRLPLGDVTVSELRAIARLADRYGEGEVRTTHDQNVLLRFVPAWRVPEVHRELHLAGLARPGARTIVDVTSCPGAATCKLAVTASRGLASLIATHLEGRPDLVAIARDLDIKASGCPNACGQHHIAGIGFQGAVRKIGGRAVPHYHVFVGGGVGPDGASFGRLVGKVPARRTPMVLERLLDLYAAERTYGEAPDRFFRRVAIERLKGLVRDLVGIEESDAAPEDYVDLGEKEAFAVEVMAGECAT
ncbi:MAG: nitrite/sulfite reductase [Acidobacteriota bacterium]